MCVCVFGIIIALSFQLFQRAALCEVRNGPGGQDGGGGVCVCVCGECLFLINLV